MDSLNENRTNFLLFFFQIRARVAQSHVCTFSCVHCRNNLEIDGITRAVSPGFILNRCCAAAHVQFTTSRLSKEFRKKILIKINNIIIIINRTVFVVGRNVYERLRRRTVWYYLHGGVGRGTTPLTIVAAIPGNRNRLPFGIYSLS